MPHVEGPRVLGAELGESGCGHHRGEEVGERGGDRPEYRWTVHVQPRGVEDEGVDPGVRVVGVHRRLQATGGVPEQSDVGVAVVADDREGGADVLLPHGEVADVLHPAQAPGGAALPSLVEGVVLDSRVQPRLGEMGVEEVVHEAGDVEDGPAVPAGGGLALVDEDGMVRPRGVRRGREGQDAADPGLAEDVREDCGGVLHEADSPMC